MHSKYVERRVIMQESGEGEGAGEVEGKRRRSLCIGCAIGISTKDQLQK
jgi:hypothetical protein